MSTNTCSAMKTLPAALLKNITIPRVEDGEVHAFLSYHEDSKDLANHIKHELKSHGFNIYTMDDDIEPGSLELAEMDHLIAKSLKVIVIISEGYLEHELSKYQVFMAHSKSGSERKKVTIPVLHEIEPSKVPSYIKEVNYIQTSENLFWERFLKALTVEIPLSALIDTTGIAEGLAWSYYYNYLLVILPKVDTLMEEKYKDSGTPYLTKMILLAPYSGKAKNLFEEYSNFVLAEPLRIKQTVAGAVDRDYNVAVFKVKDPDSDKEYYVPLEYITSLHTLHEMAVGQIAGLSTEQKQKEIDDLVAKLKEIANTLCEQVEILSFDDQLETHDEHCLTRLVIEHVQKHVAAQKEL